MHAANPPPNLSPTVPDAVVLHWPLRAGGPVASCMDRGDAHGPDTPVVLLWTGGWDSTFRLLQLLLAQRLPVEPLYLLDDTRASSKVEIATVERLRAAIGERHPHTRY